MQQVICLLSLLGGVVVVAYLTADHEALGCWWCFTSDMSISSESTLSRRSYAYSLRSFWSLSIVFANTWKNSAHIRLTWFKLLVFQARWTRSSACRKRWCRWCTRPCTPACTPPPSSPSPERSSCSAAGSLCPLYLYSCKCIMYFGVSEAMMPLFYATMYIVVYMLLYILHKREHRHHQVFLCTYHNI